MKTFMKTNKIVFGTLTIALAFLAHAHAQSFLTNGLVAYYPFDGNANDAVGTNNGTVNGADWRFSVDRFGQQQSSLFLNTTSTWAWNLNGAYVAVPRPSSLNFNSDFTLSLWVNISSGVTDARENLISTGNDSYDGANFAIGCSESAFGGQDLFGFSMGVTGGGVYPNVLLSPVRGSWWQATVVRSGTNFTIFKNGSVLTNGVAATTANNPAIWLGRFQEVPSGNGSAYPLIGGIDDVRFYDRALSASEVQQLYQYESQSQGNVTTYFNTANASAWRVAGGGATNATPYELSGGNAGSISIISGGDSGNYVAGVTNFSGFWLADYVFYLPNGAGNITLSYSNLYVDDRGLLLLNGNQIVATGIPYFGNLNPGSLVLIDGGSQQAYSSFVGPDGSVSGTVTSGFNIGGYNTLRVIINNTHSGVVGADIPVSSGDATLLTLSGEVSYTIPAPTPIVSLIKAVKPSFSNLSLGTNYQLQVSTDLSTWTNQGSAFTATNSSMIYPQYFDLDNWNELFFRLQVAP